MFCDGKCKKGSKTCGLLSQVTMKNAEGKVKTEDQCILHATAFSSFRVEHMLEGLHAAENSTRNEIASGLDKVKKVIGTGMIGMIQIAEEKKEDGKLKLSN